VRSTGRLCIGCASGIRILVCALKIIRNSSTDKLSDHLLVEINVFTSGCINFPSLACTASLQKESQTKLRNTEVKVSCAAPICFLRMLLFFFIMLQDDDECSDGTHNCSTTGGICHNTSGGFTCACQSGYDGDGYNCTGMKLLSIVTCWCLDLNNELFEFTLHSTEVKALLGVIAETAQLHTEVIVVSQLASRNKHNNFKEFHFWCSLELDRQVFLADTDVFHLSLPITDADTDVFALVKPRLKDTTVHFFLQYVGHINKIYI